MSLGRSGFCQTLGSSLDCGNKAALWRPSSWRSSRASNCVPKQFAVGITDTNTSNHGVPPSWIQWTPSRAAEAQCFVEPPTAYAKTKQNKKAPHESDMQSHWFYAVFSQRQSTCVVCAALQQPTQPPTQHKAAEQAHQMRSPETRKKVHACILRHPMTQICV